MTPTAKRLLAYIALSAATFELGGAVLYGSSHLEGSGPVALQSVIALIQASPAFAQRHTSLPQLRLCAESFRVWPSSDREHVDSLLRPLGSAVAPTPSTSGPAHPTGPGNFLQLCQSHRSTLVIGYIDSTFSSVGEGTEFRSYFLWCGIKWVHMRTYQRLVS